jgi:SnoaL-like domain
MSYSISTLLTRNLHDVFGENDPARRRATIDEIFTEDCVFYNPRGVHRGRDEIDRVAAAIEATHPDFRYQPIAGPEELGNAGRLQWVSGPLVRLQLTPGLISSLPWTAGLPLFISFSTSYRELDSAVRRPTRRIRKLWGEDVSRSLKLLCLKRNIENLSTIQEKSGCPVSCYRLGAFPPCPYSMCGWHDGCGIFAGAQICTLGFPVCAEPDAVIDRSLLKIDLINIGAARSDSLKNHRLQSTHRDNH